MEIRNFRHHYKHNHEKREIFQFGTDDNEVSGQAIGEGPEIDLHIMQQLERTYNKLLDEPIPDHLVNILKDLDEQESKS